MAGSLNAQELVDDVRSQLDEFNQADISQEHILAALNRAQKAATRITTRKLDTIFLANTVRTAADMTIGPDNVGELEMPQEIFGRQIEKIECRQGGSPVMFRIHAISYRQRDPFVLTSQVARPYYYDIKGSKLRFYPALSGGSQVIIHYSRSPDQLVLPQGQINRIDFNNNYVIVDTIGPDLSTESDQRQSYVNIIDYVTGDVKASLQIAFLDATNNQIKFKTTGLTRTTVYGKAIETAIPVAVVEDDFVCLVRGTCVPQLPDAYTDYFMQFAVVEMKRRMREPTAEDYAALKDIEDALKKMIDGREQVQRIRKANPAWNSQLGSSIRRLFS